MEQNNNQDELYHYGRVGMKWYQHIYGKVYEHAKYNKKTKSKIKKIEDDTKSEIRKLKKKAKQDYKLKSAKRKSEDKINDAKNYLEKKYGLKDKSKKTEQKETKTTDVMSDDELRKVVNRLRLENDYKRELNTYNSLNPKKVSLGKKFVKSTWNDAVRPAVTEAGKVTLEKWLKKVGNEVLDLDGNKTPTLDKIWDKEKKQMEISNYRLKTKKNVDALNNILEQEKEAANLKKKKTVKIGFDPKSATVPKKKKNKIGFDPKTVTKKKKK